MATAAARRRSRSSKGSGVLPRIVVAVLILGVIGAMAIEPTRQLIEQRRRISAMTSDVQKIETMNDALQTRIDRLNDPDFIEQRAREQVGLILPGETPYVVMPPSRKLQKRQAERERSAAEREQALVDDEPGPIEGFLSFLGF